MEDYVKPEAGTRVHCEATGGTIVYTKTGFVHYAGKVYGADAVETVDKDEE
jgi:hypothetical protein